MSLSKIFFISLVLFFCAANASPFARLERSAEFNSIDSESFVTTTTTPPLEDTTDCPPAEDNPYNSGNGKDAEGDISDSKSTESDQMPALNLDLKHEDVSNRPHLHSQEAHLSEHNVHSEDDGQKQGSMENLEQSKNDYPQTEQEQGNRPEEGVPKVQGHPPVDSQDKNQSQEATVKAVEKSGDQTEHNSEVDLQTEMERGHLTEEEVEHKVQQSEEAHSPEKLELEEKSIDDEHIEQPFEVKDHKGSEQSEQTKSAEDEEKQASTESKDAEKSEHNIVPEHVEQVDTIVGKKKDSENSNEPQENSLENKVHLENTEKEHENISPETNEAHPEEPNRLVDPLKEFSKEHVHPQGNEKTLSNEKPAISSEKEASSDEATHLGPDNGISEVDGEPDHQSEEAVMPETVVQPTEENEGAVEPEEVVEPTEENEAAVRPESVAKPSEDFKGIVEPKEVVDPTEENEGTVDPEAVIEPAQENEGAVKPHAVVEPIMENEGAVEPKEVVDQNEGAVKPSDVNNGQATDDNPIAPSPAPSLFGESIPNDLTQSRVKRESNIVYSGPKALVFLNIPYAKPPVAELAFKLPQKLEGEEYKKAVEARDHTNFGNYCPQDHKDAVDGMNKQGMKMSLDCLSLNVFSPFRQASF
uniref:Carboxylesterase type B domain-containing protein n=1 Tax=Ditylenchus dipsaci TaxID=166011 RepID=A0A915DGB8_9BILA